VYLLELLPGLLDGDVDELHRCPHVHLLHVQHQLPDVLPGGHGLYLERNDRNVHRYDRSLRADHQFDVVWLPIRLHVGDLVLLGDPHTVLVAHHLDVV
jgi:hypothetical protein